MTFMVNSSVYLPTHSNDTILQQSTCLVKSNMWFIDYLRTLYIVNCVIQPIFAIVAVSTNTLVLYAIIKTPALHKPSTVLLCNLAITDLAVGIFVQPFYVVYKIAELHKLANISCNLGVATNMFANLFSGVSFITVTLISLDRYLALHLHLRYPAVVTTERILKVLIVSWALVAFLVSFYPWKIDIAIYGGMGIVLICLIVTSYTYVKIHSVVRKHRARVHDTIPAIPSNQSQGVQGSKTIRGLNISKYWKSVITMGYVYLFLVLCYLPYMLTLGVRVLIGLTKEYKLVLNITTSVIYISSSINPFLYCYRLKEVRNAVMKVLRKNFVEEEVSATFNVVTTKSTLDLSSSNRARNPSKSRCSQNQLNISDFHAV
ncbi:alpha-1A adrenergic receptor [Nematostella vectensis]|uniref:alpha-1A adrenergic receptor n=1 Tax=Nematostella vectensis TaxID=45351 RepID=UPI002077396F|nr:alpha-1A adrenergic receptor [Nematostella vectensis]